METRVSEPDRRARRRMGRAGPARGQGQRSADTERKAAVAFLMEHGEDRLSLRVRYCARAGLGKKPCNVPAFCGLCAAIAKLECEDWVTALFRLTLADHPTLVVFAGDFTVGETGTIEEGLHFLTAVHKSLRRHPTRAWQRVLGMSYTIEIGKSPSGRWWVHMHTFFALDARDLPPAIRSIATSWARQVRIKRWPEIPFDPRSGRDELFNELADHQRVVPLRAYAAELSTGRVLHPRSCLEIEADLRGRARYLRERKGDGRRERRRPLAVLSKSDLLAIRRVQARLNGRTGICRSYSADDIERLARTLRDARMQAAHTSSRCQTSPAYSATPEAPAEDARRVRPSSPEWRSRVRARFRERTLCPHPLRDDPTAKRCEDRRHRVYGNCLGAMQAVARNEGLPR